MRRLALLVVLAAVAVAGPALAQSLGGRYRVHGTNPDGSTYDGTAVITPTGQSCRISWHVGTEWDGICILSGGNFAAAYRSNNAVGLLIFRLQPDGSLSGERTLAGSSA